MAYRRIDVAIEQRLIEAYQNAEYVVFADIEFVMSVSTYNEALEDMMTERQFTQAAFISAYNPYSELLDELKNIKRHDTLSKELSGLGLGIIEGFGRDREGQWPGEKSVLVLNISHATAQAIGNKYGQNAILWIEKNAVPQLLLLDGKKV
jgi:hypothetical protein